MADMNLTKLEAVNRILRGAREHPVSTLGATTENDTLLAEQILDEVLLREQMTGLHVNTTETSFAIDGSNHMVLPSNTLQVQGANQHQSKNYFHKETSGQVLLYDADTFPATADFSATGADEAIAYVRITQCADFEDLPAQHQFSIADQAAVEYASAVLGSSTRTKELQSTAERSRQIARAYEIRMRPNNQFEDGRSQGPRMGRWTPRGWPYNDSRRQ